MSRNILPKMRLHNRLPLRKGDTGGFFRRAIARSLDRNPPHAPPSQGGACSEEAAPHQLTAHSKVLASFAVGLWDLSAVRGGGKVVKQAERLLKSEPLVSWGESRPMLAPLLI